jgi:RecG-like helicase
MGIRSMLKNLSTPVEELDAERLRVFCTGRGHTCIRDMEARTEVTVVGEITSLRIVPHQGSPWLEATVTDGSGNLIVMWTGRRSIAGVSPGKRLAISGRALPADASNRRLKIMNPAYELLA